MRKTKPKYVIGMSGRNTTATGKYAVYHSPMREMNSKYNKSGKHFSKRSDAIKYKNKIIKDKKKKYSVDYMYMAG